MAKQKLLKTSLTILGALFLVSQKSLAIIENNGSLKQIDERPIESIIVKFNKNSSLKNMSMQGFSEYLSNKINFNLKPVKQMSSGAYVFKISNKSFNSLTNNESIQFNKTLNIKLNSLTQDPNIKYADENSYLHMQKTPNDTRYAEQWHYFDEVGGIDLPNAWEITTGSRDIVVGIVDTGIVDHKNLKGKVLPGRNFVDDEDDENEKDDPTDHGGSTSYHGSHVAGTVGALTNRAGLVSGVAWDAKILPVRVLDDSGSGSMANIIEGMRWAAGIGETENPNPAKVINLSLGGFGKCRASFQEAIDEINESGAIIVVAAGNSSLPAKYYQPASCNDVITVAANNKAGEKSFYTNHGDAIDIVAPGGDKRKGDEGGILSLGAPGEVQFLQGTSMAAPHVAGVVALMLSVDPSLTVGQAIKYLQKGAKGDLMDVGIVDTDKTLHLVQSSDIDKPDSEPDSDKDEKSAA